MLFNPYSQRPIVTWFYMLRMLAQHRFWWYLSRDGRISVSRYALIYCSPLRRAFRWRWN